MSPWQVGIWLVAAVIFGLIGQAIGKPKGRAAAGWWLGFLLGIIGVIIIACLPRSREVQVAEAQRQYEIQAEAARRAGCPYPPPQPYAPYPAYPPQGQQPYPPFPPQVQQPYPEQPPPPGQWQQPPPESGEPPSPAPMARAAAMMREAMIRPARPAGLGGYSGEPPGLSRRSR
jgi:hypothetical protein